MYLCSRVDTFTISFNGTSVSIDDSNIAWESDRRTRFRNPKDTPEAFNETLMPPSWPFSLLEYFPEDDTAGYGLENQHLIVWYRVSAFPVFRKLYGKVNVSDDEDKLPNGTYKFQIDYSILYIRTYLMHCTVHTRYVRMYLCT